MIIVMGLLLGALLGMLSPGYIPDRFSPYVSIAIIACLDCIFGAIRAMLENKFRNDIFITGFLGNCILAAILVYVGERLGIPLYLAVIIIIGGRIFENFSIIRRIILDRTRGEKDEKG